MSVELLNNISYQLLRTNPKLSTNVKVVVNSEGKIFLESFDASPELSDSRFKAFSVKEKSSLAYDLYSFYNNGTFPTDLAYGVFQESSLLSPLGEYRYQYETLYNSGTQVLPSTAYTEDMSILAPLWMNEIIPDYFVIFRIEGPLSVNEVDSSRENLNYETLLNGSNFSEYVLNKSRAIKTFDLRANTSIGKYIRNLQNDTDFVSGIEFHTQENIPSKWRGISYTEGGFMSSPEYDYEKLIIEDSSIIENEFFMTNGFQRNGIIHPRLLNLQFLFSDVDADEYEIHRYFGMYVNAVEEGSFSLDSSETFYGTADDVKQQPIPPSITYVSQDLETPFETTNPDGVKLFVNSVSTTTELPTPSSTANVDSIFYVKDKDGNFHQIKRGSQWSANELRLSDTTVDLSKFTGFVATSFQSKAKVEPFAGRASASFEINGSVPSGFNITFRDGLSSIATISAQSSITAGESNGLAFSSLGTFSEIATAIESALNNIPEDERFFSVYRSGATLYFYSRYSGSRFNSLNILYTNFGTSLDFLEAYPGISSLFITQFNGGNDNPTSRIRIKREDLVNFSAGNYLKGENLYGEITEISLYLDDPIVDDNNIIQGFRGVEDYYVVVTDGTKLLLNSFNEAIVYEAFKPTFGRFSFFPVKDFDFDFFSTEYSDLGELEIETEFYTDPGNPLSDHPDVSDFYRDGGFANIQGIVGDVQVNGAQPPAIASEYDRLNENYVKELAINSRTVPYINKWGYSADGKDVRNNPYRLDLSRAFGSFNFGPTDQVFDRDTSAFTHEWYYLSKAPAYFDENDIKRSWSYFSEKLLEVDLKNTSVDKFKEYFVTDVVNDYLGTPVLIDRQLRYSEIDGGTGDSFAQTFLRGIKVLPKEKANYTDITSFNTSSLALVKNERFNGYRFSAILIPNDDDEPNFKIKFIENKKWKTLTLLIYLRIEIDCFDEGEAIVDRTMLYALNSKIESFTGCDYLEPTGGYTYEDVRISGGIDASYPPVSSGLTNILKGITNTFDGSTPSFLSEIRARVGGGGDGNYPDIVFEVTTGTTAQTGFYKVQGITRILSDNELQFTQILKWDGSSYSIPVSWPQTFGLDNFTSVIMYAVDAGYEGLSPRINKASFASLYEKINQGDPSIDYITVDANGNETSGEFIVELVTPKGFIKPVYVNSVSDPDKPVQFNLIDTVGYRLSLMQKTRLVPFFRHEGVYEPMFNDVMKYVDPFIGPNNPSGTTSQDNINRNIRDLCRYKNTQFNTSDVDFGVIKNLFYHKVNPVDPGSVTQLSAESAYQSVYPLIGEAAIDKKNFYVFSSNWDPGYFTQNLSGNEKILRNGTRSQFEKKSFFASKVMKTPNEIIIQTFTPVEFNKKALIDNSAVDGNLMFQNEATSVNLYSLTNKRATEYFFEFVKAEFEKYVNPRYSYGSEETIDDDVNYYIQQNILTIYQIKSISLFVRRQNGNGAISYSFMTQDNNDKLQNGLTITDNFGISYPSDSRLDFSLIYNLDKGYNYDFGLSVTLEKK